MKIFILVDRVKPYGAERVAWSIAEHLSVENEVSLVTFSRSAPDALSDGAPFKYHRISSRQASYTTQAITMMRDLRKLALVEHADVTISFMPTANSLAALALLGLPTKVIATEHNVPSRTTLSGLPGFINRISRSATYRLADSIVAVSDVVRSDLAKFLWIKEFKVRRIYNPLEYDRIKHFSMESNVCMPDVPKDQIKLLVVGRLKSAKGHVDAIRALSFLPNKYALYFVGDGQLEDSLRKLAQELGLQDRVNFAGFQENPYCWMRWADLLLVPSTYEGFGLVVAEAASLGLPVITSDDPALMEVARLTGASSVKRGDAPGLASACLNQSAKERPVPKRVPDFDARRVASFYNEIATQISG